MIEVSRVNETTDNQIPASLVKEHGLSDSITDISVDRNFNYGAADDSSNKCIRRSFLSLSSCCKKRMPDPRLGHRSVGQKDKNDEHFKESGFITEATRCRT